MVKVKQEPTGTNVSNIPETQLELLKRQFNLPTGLVYDVRLLNHDQLVERSRDFHPEAPLRIYSIFSELEKSGCLALMKGSRPERPMILNFFISIPKSI
ncbi:Histone deacetylase hda1 [Entomophthora muscae]|uniref:Histone deacetylase hda1 n=1 Tax=Entomophthora muscae TaxID=34485 RepID=A0ACC2TDS6_9FUNG|nr:Histone deacetylase hda1 [Entomophthora muscae]